MWEISPTADAVPLASSIPNPPLQATALDLETTLRRWGAPIISGSHWLGFRDEGGAWCVAPVRARPAAPPPGGRERRGRARLILELAGLGLGSLNGSSGGTPRRLPPEEALWDMARQPSVIAHEVGNPLAVALGNLDLSIDSIRGAGSLDSKLREELLDDLHNVAEGIDQAAEYLRSIQDKPFGAVGRRVRFDATPVIRSCVTLERPVARKRGVGLLWTSSVDSAFLYGESTSLYQVTTNLIRNAVDASRERRTAVEVSLQRMGESLRLVVQDGGTGIAPEHVSRIFEPGFTTKPPGQGSGMGLAVVREITHSMFGGTIQVESHPGEGSTFTLTLPIPPQRGGE